MFTRCLRADFYKMKRSSVIIAHIIIPIVVSAVFLAYYAISGWNETDKITLRSKTAALFSKVVTLLVFGLFALLFTAVIFGFGFNMIHGHSIASMGLFVRAVLVMWLSAIPLYLIFEIFAFVFGKAFAIGAGLISGLISALFLTDIGMYVWKIVPLSWTARIPETFLAYELADRGALSEIKSHAPIYLVVVAVCFAGYFAFATNYEGSKISE